MLFCTGLAGGSMAARSPRILSLEHSEKTCSCREALESFPSVSLTSDNAELNVPGLLSDAGRGKDALQFQEINARCKLHSKPQTWVLQSALFQRSCLLRTTTGERGSSLDTDGVWLRLGESSVSWATSFLLSPSPVLGGDDTSNGGLSSSLEGLF